MLRGPPCANRTDTRLPDTTLFRSTNQFDVACGLVPEAALTAVQERITARCRDVGVEVLGFYYCPRHPEGAVPEFAIDCGCRKPADGLLRRAAEDLGVPLSEAWMVGDILDDVEAGNRAGCRTVLIDNGDETEWRLPAMRWPNA